MNLIFEYPNGDEFIFKAEDFYISTDNKLFILGYSESKKLYEIINIREKDNIFYWTECKVFDDEFQYQYLLNNLNTRNLNLINNYYETGIQYFENFEIKYSPRLDYFLTDNNLYRCSYWPNSDDYLIINSSSKWVKTLLEKPNI
jgi:hypothetical protein